MRGHTNVTLIGNVGRTPDIRHLGTGSAVATFSLAINEVWTDKAGERKEQVHWFDCEAWGRTAETLAQYVAAGAPLFVAGRLKQDRWTDDAGQKRTRVKVAVDTYRLLGKREQAEDHEQPPASVTQATPAPAKPLSKWADEVGPITEDDIPF